MALTELLFIFPQHIWNMIEQRWLPSQRLPDVYMPWRARYPFLAPQQVCYPHQMVIDDVREMISRKTIRFEYDFIINIGILEDDVAMKLVVDDCITVQRHSKPNH